MKEHSKYRQEVDTNVFQFSMSCLKQDAQYATGDPITCEACKVIFNKYSKLEQASEEKSSQKWACEFCNHINIVSVEPEEVPTKDAVNYIVETSTKMEDVKEEKDKSGNDITVVYCIDVSGSMDGTRL